MCSGSCSCQCISSLSRVTSGTRRFLWAAAMRLSQVSTNTLEDPVHWFGCGDRHWQSFTSSPKKIVCLDMLALRVSPVNGLEPVEDMPMSLLASKREPRQTCGHAAHCSATLSAKPSIRALRIPTQTRGSTVADVPFSIVPYQC